jgi:hypothetical protein
MKKLSAIIFLLLFLSLPITAQAKDYSKSLKTVSFSTLSDKDMEDTINSLVSKISGELALPYTPRVSCYEYDWAVLAHNTLYPIGDYGPTICVNLRPFKADTENSSQQIVQTIAHEVRHSYQYEHQNDDSDYGRNCYQGIHNYNAWYEDIGAYYIQWLEQDANDYATQYVERYFS